MSERFFEPLLLEPLENLELSEALVLACGQNGLYTLADLLRLDMSTLLGLPGFDHRLWNEYVAFLEERHMAYYLN